jgi:hypothetical protein
LNAPGAVVASNVVRGGVRSLVLAAPAESATVMGNATTQDIVVGQGTSLATTPWAPFNVRIN